MPYSEKIIAKIDSLIAESSLTDARFSPRLMAGLVQQIPTQSRVDASKLIWVPAKLNGLNDAAMIVPDDAYNLITYHRLISNAYAAREGKGQYGDGYDVQICTSDVIMIVIGFYSKLRLTTEQIEAILVSALPTSFDKEFITGLQMDSIIVQPTSASFDSVAIFNQEYRGETYFIKPEMSLFQIRYKIEASYKKGCFKICDDCE